MAIQDFYFLFYDIFLLFEEENLTEVFMDSLKPFILAGRFQKWDFIEDILTNHIINYYKDPSKPEVFEKVLINLSLKNLPKQYMKTLITFSENYFLSTTLVYLYNISLENDDSDTHDSCIPLILSLLDLYRRAGEVNIGTLRELG